MVSKMEVIALYKNLLREASKFPAYNFRMYGFRRIRDGFRMNKDISDKKVIEEKYAEGLEALEMLKRQVILSSLYKAKNLVIENK
ncbi:LYR motif-containing protein bcn92 isoform X1 [Rhodnius prolixus]|uniref:Putative nadh complex 1 protein lyr family n=1 Tax=Rhodnius prolixus TaxID=13249 RepID=R4FK45_RHOPR